MWFLKRLVRSIIVVVEARCPASTAYGDRSETSSFYDHNK